MLFVLAKFLFSFLLVSAVFWLIFIFVARAVIWVVCRIVGASVAFRLGGLKRVRDVMVKLKKGPIESVTVGEIKLSFRQSLLKIGAGILSRDPKLHILICQLEIVMRAPSGSSSKPKTRKSRSSGSGKGKGKAKKLMVVANIARFLSVTMDGLVVKTPKATLEIHDLDVEISREAGSKPNLCFKLQIFPIIVKLPDARFSCNGNERSISSSQTSTGSSPAPFNCKEFLISCEFGPDREIGISIKNVDIHIGRVAVNLNEVMLPKGKSSSSSSAVSSQTDAVPAVDPAADAAKKQNKKQAAMLALSKSTPMIPDKVAFALTRIDVKFVHEEHSLFMEHNITGFQLRCTKSQTTDDFKNSTRVDIQVEFNEIHLLRESNTSIVEILKLDIVSLLYIPIEPTFPVKTEVDVKLGRSQFTIAMNRVKPWLQLHLSNKKKKMVLKEGTAKSEKPTVTQSSEPNIITWSVTFAAPELALVVYSLDDIPLYRACSKSLHFFANNVSNMGMTMHTELGGLYLYIEEEYKKFLKENLTDGDTNSGSILHVAKVCTDMGKKEVEGQGTEDIASKSKLALTVGVNSVGVSFTFKHIESFVSTALSFQALMKSLLGPKKKAVPNQGSRESSSAKPSSGKGVRLIKFNLEQCCVNISAEAGLEDSTVADPKRVNYGSQGGRFVISESADGTPRTASVLSTLPEECKKFNFSTSLDISHLTVSLNKDKQSTHMEIKRARSIYEDYLLDHMSSLKVTLLDVQNAKFVRRASGHKDCSLFSATDIAVRWEPDLQISLVELGLSVKSLLQSKKLQQPTDPNLQDVPTVSDVDKNKEITKDSKSKKKEVIFAVDIEMLTISAEAGDGVDVLIQVQSIFSENAKIGVLVEGLIFIINGARVVKSSRMQVSRIPRASTSDAKQGITTWDYVVQGLDIHIFLPFRLELRAIDDAYEDMVRALKLIIASKTKIFLPPKPESTKPKKPSTTKLGCIKVCVRKLTADIEEEPLQGWLDEHYNLLKYEVCEVHARLKYLDDLIKRNANTGNTDANDGNTSEKKLLHDGLEIDLQDPSSVAKVQEEIHKQSFRAYYQACQNIRPSEGSGACSKGFQSGFKFSSSRFSVMAISATELDLTLTTIEGGEDGMIEFVRKMDPAARDYDIPFARFYGCNLLLRTSSLAAHIRDYTYPLFSATLGKCEGCIVLAQQATYFQPQVYQDVYVGRWRKVMLLRSATGTTPAMKTYMDLPIYFQKAEVSYGVGYETVFADISYAFTVALRRAYLSVRKPDPNWAPPPKKEKSLPWWDDMRQYIHGHINLYFNETRWYIFGTSDPYEKLEHLQVVSGHMEIQQSDGRVYLAAKDFKIFISSLENLAKHRSLKLPVGVSDAFLETPEFIVEILMDWGCESGMPLNHYLFALPNEGRTKEIVFDPYRSTALAIKWDIYIKPVTVSPVGDGDTVSKSLNSEDFWSNSPTFRIAPHDLKWLQKFAVMQYLPPNKIRFFSRWPRFGCPRILRSGNLSLDRVITEFMLRLDITPIRIKHVALRDDDGAKGLTFRTTKVKCEMYQSRGKQEFTFDCIRPPLELVYLGLEIHLLKAFLDKSSDIQSLMSKIGQTSKKNSQAASMDRVPSEKDKLISSYTEKSRDDGFFMSSDYFTIRKQAPKADPATLSAWQEAGKKNVEMNYVRSEFENGSGSDGQGHSDQSDDEGFNVVIADNCQRIFLYGLKILWSIENRDAVMAWVGGLGKAFEPSKPSPSKLYAQAQKKLRQEIEAQGGDEVPQNDASSDPPASNPDPSPASTPVKNDTSSAPPPPAPAPANTDSVSSSTDPQAQTSGVTSSTTDAVKAENLASVAIAKNAVPDPEEEGTRHFMVNVIEPQFNLHSEDANGRFLLAAASGRVLVRSFHSVLQVGLETIEKALGSGDKPGNGDASGTSADAAKTKASPTTELSPELTWKRMEISVMLERVQAHVAPTDVDPGAGIQWLPKISKKHAKVKRTGVLLERVFTPCDMYLQFTRHNGWTPDLKMKPLKELAFNSHDITASMTSRQFQVMMDVLTNLLFARNPKRRRDSLTYPIDDDEDDEEEADKVVPYGVEEVELAKIKVEAKEREQILLIDDIRKLSNCCDTGDSYREVEGDLWMITNGKSALVSGLVKELPNVQKSRKEASSELRTALRKAAAARLMEKEKNKSPSCAMRVSLKITKIVWDMLLDGKPFAGAEINDMICDYDRDYRDVGIVLLTTKSITFKNCLANAKSDTLLSAWNPPAEWGKKVMVRVDAKQGAPKEGYSVLELLQVEIYPLKIHLTETMYRMMWSYLFAAEDQDSQRRQEVWKVSTTAGSKRVKKGQDSSGRPTETASKPQSTSFLSNPLQALKLQNIKPNIVSGQTTELRRSSSFDRSWEETVAESVATELVLQAAADSKSVKSGQSSQDDKKLGKAGELEKKPARPQKLMEFHNIKISQVELCVTYEGSRFVVSDLKLLMDTFHRDEFTGTWRRLFSRVKKHIIWGVLKSVTGMQGAKFKDKSGNSKEAIAAAVAENELNLSDNEGGPTEKSDQLPVVFPKRQGGDMAGDGFVTSVRGLFNNQRKKAKKFVLRTMRGEENEIERSESDVEVSPFARQLTITKAKKLIRRHTKKFDTKGHKGSPRHSEELLPSSPMAGAFESDSSSDSDSPFSDVQEGSLSNKSG